jgi:hypothetical protein
MLIGGSIGFILCVVMLILTSHFSKKQDKANTTYALIVLKSIMEAGYVQGQADALKGDIKVRPINDSTYVWTSNPYFEHWSTSKPINDTVNVNIKHK